MCPLVMTTLAGVSIARHDISHSCEGAQRASGSAPGSPDGSLARR